MQKFNSKPLRIKFNKIDGFIRIYDGTRYLVLFGSEKYDSIYNKTRYLRSVKSVITYIIFIFFVYNFSYIYIYIYIYFVDSYGFLKQ